MTPDRFDALDFVLPLGYDNGALFVGEVEREEIVTDSFLVPFATDLWLCLLLVGLTITFLAMVQRVYDKGPSWQILSFTGGVLWVTLTVYFSKRIERFPKEVVWKGTLLGTLFVGNFVFIAYRASLTSSLSVPPTNLPFTNFGELYARGDYDLVTLRGDAHADYLAQAGEDTDQHRVWKNR